MKYLLLFAAIIATSTSCHPVSGSGNIIKEKRQTSDFRGIDAGGAFEVELKTGATTDVQIECDDNLMKYIETNVSAGILHINTKGNLSISNGHFKAFVTAPEINSVKCSGAAYLQTMDPLKDNGKINFEASGAGNIKAEVDAPEIAAEASGAGNIELSGKTRSYSAKASGGATLKTKKLQSEKTDAEASGAATMHVYSSVELKTDASGAANIFYSGGGTVQKKTSGAANINPE